MGVYDDESPWWSNSSGSSQPSVYRTEAVTPTSRESSNVSYMADASSDTDTTPLDMIPMLELDSLDFSSLSSKDTGAQIEITSSGLSNTVPVTESFDVDKHRELEASKSNKATKHPRAEGTGHAPRQESLKRSSLAQKRFNSFIFNKDYFSRGDIKMMRRK
jgi:hypothetical protein